MNSFYFSLFRCSDCAKLKPNFDAAAEDFARKGKFVFAKVGVRSIKFIIPKFRKETKHIRFSLLTYGPATNQDQNIEQLWIGIEAFFSSVWQELYVF